MKWLGKMSVAVLLCSAGIVNATSFNFSCITGNSATNCDAGENQIMMDVLDRGVNVTTGFHQVEFLFNNAVGGAASSIEQIYFYDGTLLGIANIVDAPNAVSFKEGNNQNAQLPGLGLSNPVTKMFEIFDAEAQNPAPHRGVNPGESVGIVFDLLAGKDYDDVLSALFLPLDPNNGSLMVGMHVIAFDNGGSESFVHAVPIPGAIWLFVSALGFFGVKRLRSSSRSFV